jgi:hypothetical protein
VALSWLTVKLARLLNCIAYLAVFAVSLTTGSAICTTAKCFSIEFSHSLPGRHLPALTNFILSYGSSGASIWINLILGLIFTALLFFFEFGGEKRKAFIPFLMATTFILSFLQLTNALLGVTMAFIPMLDGLPPSHP